MSDKTTPWNYAYEGSGTHTIYAADGNSVVATAEEGCGFNRIDAANHARLIAAAPDLLAACEELLKSQMGLLDPKCNVLGVIDRANAAIAKAKTNP